MSFHTDQEKNPHIFTKDLCPSTTQAVVRATNNGGMALISLPCPMSLFECWPAGPWVILSLWTTKKEEKHQIWVSTLHLLVDFDFDRGGYIYLNSGTSQQTQWYIPTSKWFK